MNYHVFIVDETTFKVHLKYLFAGTGAGDKRTPFLLNANTTIHPSTERNLAGMIADVSRVRVNDKIIFYLQSKNNKEGKFFGIFMAKTKAFFDENDENNYLLNDLNKGLSFRILIAPDEVFPCGISEHEYLDSLEGINSPYQMCWSLIYRKLKGNRGCTMITENEFHCLRKKLMRMNNNTTLNGHSFSFDSENNKIVINNISNTYSGSQHSIDIKNRLLYKANLHQAFETHLQAYILQNLDSPSLSQLLLPLPNTPFWIGNEVSCGVGMQRIDLLIKQENIDNIYIKLIELKCVQPEPYIINEQLPWYIRWLSYYYIPNLKNCGKNIFLTPCIIALPTSDDEFTTLLSNTTFEQLIPEITILPTEYIKFTTTTNDISFYS